MNPTQQRSTDRSDDFGSTCRLHRRRFMLVGAVAGGTLLAGCSADTGLGGTGGSEDGPSTGGSEGADGSYGTFRLLISDQPVAISDFDSLNVSFERARIFRSEGGEPGDGTETSAPSPTESGTGNETTTDTASPTSTGTETVTVTTTTEPESATGTENGAGDDGDQRGFSIIDLDGASVDLTQVVGEKAVGIFEGELPEGRYTKIELYASDVDGVVGGKAVDVKIPSGKLQIVKPFEVEAGETLSFVFDINVVKKGQSGEYNLLPVIAKSGIAGEDVEVEEVRGEEDEPEEVDDDGVETDPPGGDAGGGGGDGGDGGDGGGPPGDGGDGS